MDANREALANSGYYGSGLQSFLAWLTAKIDDQNHMPAARVIDEDAIELVTWHSSKGREWPVVVVAEIERKINAGLPNMEIGYQSFENLSTILSEVQIEYSPKYSAPESCDKHLASLQRKANQQARRLLYVAITRARDKLILEWPSYVKDKPGSYFSLLTNDGSVQLGTEKLRVNSVPFDCNVFKGGTLLPEEVDENLTAQNIKLRETGRRAIKVSDRGEAITPDSISPSMFKDSQERKTGEQELVNEQYATALKIESDLPANILGTALHRAFEVVGHRPEFTEKLGNILKRELDVNLMVDVANNIREFEEWIKKRFAPDEIYREMPFLSIDENGSVINGTIDLIIKNRDGVIIIDHKSDLVENSTESFEKYRKQLSLYAMAIEKKMGPVLSMGINWIRNGEVVFT
jgi:ATP-dependent exoDNAse (exonuclease V) beta subunit